MSVLDWARDVLDDARYQCLESILNLRPATNTLGDYVRNWTFLPLEFNEWAEGMVNAPPKYTTTDSYNAVQEFTNRYETRITFDPTWLQDDLAYLETLLSAKSASESVQRQFLQLDTTQELYDMAIEEEHQAAEYIQTQIRAFLLPVVKSAFDSHIRLGVRLQPRQFGPGHSTMIADAQIFLIKGKLDLTDLVKGEYKVPRVLTYRVLLWIIWLARSEFALDKDPREDACPAEKVASRILNPVSRSD